MQAILTKYLGATNNKPARIKAWNADGKSAIVSLSFCEDRAEENNWKSGDESTHRAAAEYLCTKMGWKGELKGGGIKGGYAFVFVN